MNKTLVRIMNDYIDFNKNKPDGIYLWVNKMQPGCDIFTQYALIVGPPNTPYFGGFFFFEIKFPDDYPNKPPAIKLLTINKNIRFNPNLYENGKVCLSIIGTWDGPSWKPIMNIRLVLNSIMSLMGEYPLQNEPGFEKVNPNDLSSIEYNTSIIYYTYMTGIIDVFNNKYNEVSKYFENEIIEEFIKNYDKLLNDLLSYQLIYNKVTIHNRVYFMTKQVLDFNELVTNFKSLDNNPSKK